MKTTALCIRRNVSPPLPVGTCYIRDEWPMAHILLTIIYLGTSVISRVLSSSMTQTKMKFAPQQLKEALASVFRTAGPMRVPI